MRIENNDVALIQELPGTFNYDENSKMAGQTYKRFSFGGKVFISNDETFRSELENGGVQCVTLEPNADGKLSLTGFITYKKLQGIKRNQMMLESITVENFKVQVENPADLIA